MEELTTDTLEDALNDDEHIVLIRLTFRDRGPQAHTFRAERAALQQMGATYDYRIRAWRVPSDPQLAEPLARMLRRTSAVAYSAHELEDLSADVLAGPGQPRPQYAFA